MNESITQVTEPAPTKFGNPGYIDNRPRLAAGGLRSFTKETLPAAPTTMNENRSAVFQTAYRTGSSIYEGE